MTSYPEPFFSGENLFMGGVSRRVTLLVAVVFWSAYACYASYVGIEQLIQSRPKSGCLLLVIGGFMLLAAYYSWLGRWGRMACLAVIVYVLGDTAAVFLPMEMASQQ